MIFNAEIVDFCASFNFDNNVTLLKLLPAVSNNIKNVVLSSSIKPDGDFLFIALPIHINLCL